MRPRVVTLLILAARPGAAAGQTFDVSLPAGRFTVGDPLAITCSIQIPARATLLDPVPRLLEELPPDMTLGPLDTLRLRGASYDGRLPLTLVRAGLQNLPVFFVRYRREGEAAVDTLTSRPLPVEIASVLPSERAQPRDVQRLEAIEGADRIAWWPAAAAALLAAIVLVWSRRRSRSVQTPEIPAASPAAPADPYQMALDRLAEIEAAGWPARGAVDRHYDLVTDVLRRYLVAAAGIEALERTTPELLRLLPPALAAADGCPRLLAEADLVKFARMRPDAMRAAAYLDAVRSLLSRWHDLLGHADAIR